MTRRNAESAAADSARETLEHSRIFNEYTNLVARAELHRLELRLAAETAAKYGDAIGFPPSRKLLDDGTIVVIAEDGVFYMKPERVGRQTTFTPLDGRPAYSFDGSDVITIGERRFAIRDGGLRHLPPRTK